MKTLIVIREKDYAWLLPFFPGVHPLVVPICNKPFIEFLIDFAIFAGSKSVRIVSDGPLRSVEAYGQTGSRWGIELGYASIQPEDSFEKIMGKNRKYASEGRLLVISGFMFIAYRNKEELGSYFSTAPAGTLLQHTLGSVSLTGMPATEGAVPDTVPFTISGLDSIASYHRLNADILKELPSPYVLPGYSNEPDCHIGRNVVISKGAEVIKPVVIGNNVQIMKGAVVGPFAVVGSNVIIDSESTVSGSVLLDNTYIGEQLDVIDRIASGNMLIEPETGISIVMEDPHLLTGINSPNLSGAGLLRYLVHAGIAVLLILLLSVPFLLLFPLLKLRGKWITKRKTCFGESHQSTISLAFPSISGNGVLCTLAEALSLDRFPLLFKVLEGRIAVIGSNPQETGGNTGRYPSLAAGYRPALYSYAEAEDWPVNSEEGAIVERYFASHGGLFQDLVLVVKAFLNRMHSKDRQ